MTISVSQRSYPPRRTPRTHTTVVFLGIHVAILPSVGDQHISRYIRYLLVQPQSTTSSPSSGSSMFNTKEVSSPTLSSVKTSCLRLKKKNTWRVWLWSGKVTLSQQPPTHCLFATSSSPSPNSIAYYRRRTLARFISSGDQNIYTYGYEVHGNVTNVYNGGISQDLLDDPISEATLQLLARKAAPNACYDSEQRFPPPNCHPGTRKRILEDLGKWIEDDSKVTKAFWLYDPNLFHASCEIQFEKLIIEPCSKIEAAEWENLPNTIIIDGLDECVHIPSQERLLTIIQKFAIAHRTLEIPVPWIFLVCSRPEPQIRDAFDNFRMVLRRLDVNSSDDAFRDIKKYFVDQFAVLRAKHHRALPRGGSPWPRGDAIDQLAERAQGQFIFAATVIKFIDTRDEPPQDRLDAVLRIYIERGSDSPYSDLDLLYHQILSTCQMWEKVQLVLRLLVTSHFELGDGVIHLKEAGWRSVMIIEGLLNLKQGDDMSNITVAHASFTEFLCDVNRSMNYHAPRMSQSEYCECVTLLLLRSLSTLALHYPPHNSLDVFTTTFSSWKRMLAKYQVNLMSYSCRYWHNYCTKVRSPGTDLLVALRSFDPYCALAASLSYNYWPRVDRWAEVLEWAKRTNLRGDVIEKWKPLSSGFRIGFPPTIPRGKALWCTFEIERCFCDREFNVQFQRALLQEVYSVRAGKYGHLGNDRVIMILPADEGGPMRLPENWIVAHLTQANAEVFERISVALRHDFDGQRLLLDDVRDDTWGSVSHNLVDKDDLVALKLHLKKRWMQFFLKDLGWPSNSLSSPSYGGVKTAASKFVFSSFADNRDNLLPAHEQPHPAVLKYPLHRRLKRYIVRIYRRKRGDVEEK
ncbi:NWD2 protein [Moniliophthora roreri MCA 2997]|uniref:NWD2 protein n=1 Tax=Moniliophthora roreri (strain MCA 2997) TaxID=1381753 RepID=V2X2Q6_MONRO|nr:NWD2 protein [Moniliophthora roreri MCA 2997]